MVRFGNNVRLTKVCLSTRSDLAKQCLLGGQDEYCRSVREESSMVKVVVRTMAQD